MAPASDPGRLSRFISASRAIPDYPSLLPIEIEGTTLTIVDSNLPGLLISSRDRSRTRAWCEFLFEYPDIVRIPEELREEVDKKLLEYRLEAANGNA